MILTDANAGSHKFRIVVNPQHAIAETDFTNNTSPTLDVVVPAGYCTLGHTNANTAQEILKTANKAFVAPICTTDTCAPSGGSPTPAPRSLSTVSYYSGTNYAGVCGWYL